jgi:hypothetical protein
MNRSGTVMQIRFGKARADADSTEESLAKTQRPVTKRRGGQKIEWPVTYNLPEVIHRKV